MKYAILETNQSHIYVDCCGLIFLSPSHFPPSQSHGCVDHHGLLLSPSPFPPLGSHGYVDRGNLLISLFPPPILVHHDLNLVLIGSTSNSIVILHAKLTVLHFLFDRLVIVLIVAVGITASLSFLLQKENH